MKKTILAAAIAISGIIPNQAIITKAVAADNMVEVRIIIKKMRASMENMKEFDALEKAGMDKRDVDQLRYVTKEKINQMTADAVELIRAL